MSKHCRNASELLQLHIPDKGESSILSFLFCGIFFSNFFFAFIIITIVLLFSLRIDVIFVGNVDNAHLNNKLFDSVYVTRPNGPLDQSLDIHSE